MRSDYPLVPIYSANVSLKSTKGALHFQLETLSGQGALCARVDSKYAFRIPVHWRTRYRFKVIVWTSGLLEDIEGLNTTFKYRSHSFSLRDDGRARIAPGNPFAFPPSLEVRCRRYEPMDGRR